MLQYIVFACLVLLSIMGCQKQTSHDEKKNSVNTAKEKTLVHTKFKAEARWISRYSIVWKLEEDALVLTQDTYKLYYHPTGEISLTNDSIQVGKEGEIYSLPFHGIVGDGNDFEPDKKVACFPYLKGRIRLSTENIQVQIPELLKGHLVITREDSQGKVKNASALQLAGIIDDLYATSQPLGVVWNNSTPMLRLWAPTAKSVKVHLYYQKYFPTEWPQSPFAMSPCLEKEGWNGIWEIQGQSNWNNQFYLYEVEVFVRSTGKVEKNLVTDPYSVSLSINGEKSQIVNLQAPHLKPKAWDSMEKPVLSAFEDIFIYELHVRDFSIFDPKVPLKNRGKYLAFTHKQSLGMNHLKSLADSGLTHIHLLPVFDIATIEEDPLKQKNAYIPLHSPPDSPQQQAQVEAVKDKDGFNWGYDPVHYMVPEGSYSVEPNGSRRIWEFRSMVQSLNNIGLRVIMDVVFNHTYTAGQNPKSVLDRIVPGYYYRLDDNGNIQNTSCCPDTASEHAMMEKLILDSLILWAVQYKVDGFRFDLMGHHTISNMKRIRQALDSLTLSKDGVDGKKIYVYGEAWKFGSLYDILPEQACHQVNTYGLGIGSFNDRIRDSLRGGSPFSDLPAQGFVNGLYYDFNQDPGNREVPATREIQKALLLNYMDNIRIGMAGNLKDFQFIDAEGNLVSGWDIKYRGQPHAGYASDPEETINYVSVHDNHTLWDTIAAKAPFRTLGRIPETATLEERVQMQKLALSIIALSQGIPFFHAGSELLRSKSGDKDSYNSGDWFNRLDFSFQTNNWGVGLPLAEKNKSDWDFWKPRLSDSQLKPGTQHILACKEHFQTMLAIRKSSPLFRLRTREDIQNRLKFMNTGPKQIAGLIVMSLFDQIPRQARLDGKVKQIAVLFNATREYIKFSEPSWKDVDFTLHPLLALQKMDKEANFDKSTGTITVPPRTTLVYWEKDSTE